MSHYTDNLCANFEVAPGRANKRIRYASLTMSLHWFRLWLGAAYTTHHCLNKWLHKPTMYVCVTWPSNVDTWRPRQNGRHLPDDPDSKVHGVHLGPTRVLSAPDGPHVGLMNLAIIRGHFQINFLEWKCMVFLLRFHWNLFLRVRLTIFQHRFK